MEWTQNGHFPSSEWKWLIALCCVASCKHVYFSSANCDACHGNKIRHPKSRRLINQILRWQKRNITLQLLSILNTRVGVRNKPTHTHKQFSPSPQKNNQLKRKLSPPNTKNYRFSRNPSPQFVSETNTCGTFSQTVTVGGVGGWSFQPYIQDRKFHRFHMVSFLKMFPVYVKNFENKKCFFSPKKTHFLHISNQPCPPSPPVVYWLKIDKQLVAV